MRWLNGCGGSNRGPISHRCGIEVSDTSVSTNTILDSEYPNCLKPQTILTRAGCHFVVHEKRGYRQLRGELAEIVTLQEAKALSLAKPWSMPHTIDRK